MYLNMRAKEHSTITTNQASNRIAVFIKVRTTLFKIIIIM